MLEYEALARALENVEAAMKVLEDLGDSDAADLTYESLCDAHQALRHGLYKCERLLLEEQHG